MLMCVKLEFNSQLGEQPFIENLSFDSDAN